MNAARCSSGRELELELVNLFRLLACASAAMSAGV
jgi:hypothetical protein